MFKDALVLLANKFVGAHIKNRRESHCHRQCPYHAHHCHTCPECHALWVKAVVCDGHVACNADAEQHEGGMKTEEHCHEGHHLAAQHAIGPGWAILYSHQHKGEADGWANSVCQTQVQQEVVGCLVQGPVPQHKQRHHQVAHQADADDQPQ